MSPGRRDSRRPCGRDSVASPHSPSSHTEIPKTGTETIVVEYTSPFIG